MKKISVLVLSVVMISSVFISCDKEEENGPIDLALIEGKWSFNKTSYTNYSITSPKINYPGNEDGCSNDYIEIKPAGVIDLGDYDTVDCVLDVDTGTWSQSGTNITIGVENSDLTGTSEITTLTATELVLKIRRDDGSYLNQSFTRM